MQNMKIEFRIGGDRTEVSSLKDIPAVYIVGVKLQLDEQDIFCPLIVGETKKLKTRMEQYIDPFEMPGREIFDFKNIKSLKHIENIYNIIKEINGAPKNDPGRITHINDNCTKPRKMIFFNNHKYSNNFYGQFFTDFKKNGYLSLCKQLYLINHPKNLNLAKIKKIIESKLYNIDNFYSLYYPVDSKNNDDILKDPHQYKNPTTQYDPNILTRKDKDQLARIRIENTTKKALELHNIHTSAKNEAHIGKFTISLPKISNTIYMDIINKSTQNHSPKISFH
jgi:hypothetical protein